MPKNFENHNEGQNQEENSEPKKFIEKREPGRILDSFDYKGEGAVIRYAKEEDRQSIIEVVKARWKERVESEDAPDDVKKDYQNKLLKCETEGFHTEEMTPFEKSFSDSHAPLFIIATVDDNIVGYIELGDRSERDTEALWISTISLLPEYQGKKFKKGENQEETSFAHELLEHGVGQARQETILKDRKKIALFTHTWTPRAAGFWTKEGFKPEGPTEYETIKMVKPLE